MATYETPAYDYSRKVSNLGQNKGLQDAAQDYGRFLGQERFRRQNADMTQGFKRNFGQVGTAFNRRGMWNSGLRQEGQQRYVQDYQRDLGRSQYDEAAQEQQFQMQRTQGDASYKQALQELYDQYRTQGLTGPDPFAAVRPLIGG